MGLECPRSCLIEPALQLTELAGSRSRPQAEARGRRLGASGKLQIVQLLVKATIEEAVHAQLAEARKSVEDGKKQSLTAEAGAGTSAEHARSSAGGGATSQRVAGKRPRVEPESKAKKDEVEDGKQATMLNKLKLLREESE